MIRIGWIHRLALFMGCLGGFLCLPLSLWSADTPMPKKVVSLAGITEYKLDNGVKVLLFPDPSTSKVTVNMTVFVGSRHEGYGETGMAHLLEHMVFKGTPTHPDVPKALRDRGASFNGTTWVDRTNYFETLNASDENLEFAIRLEADRLVNSYVKREDLVSEMTVVRNEFERGENNPENILSQRMMAVAYEWHNYGKSTIGNRSDIERVPIEKLQAFYKKFYQPDNVMVIVAGRFDEKKALQYVQKYFGSLKAPKRELDDTYTEEPPQDGERTVVLRRIGNIGVVGAIYHVPAGAHEEFPAVEVLSQVLTSSPSGRLYKSLVETELASRVSSSAFAWHDPGVFEIAAQVDKNQSLEKVRDTMLATLAKLKDEPPTEDEVERAKRRLLKNRELLMTDSNRIGVVLSEWASKGDWRLFFLHRDRLAKVSAKDVANVASKYLTKNNRTIGFFYPSETVVKAEIPPTPDITALMKDYKGSGETVAQGEFFDPTIENIEERVRRTQLPSGIKVALLPKKTRGESVTVDLTLRYGNEESLTDKTTAAQFVASLMMRGTKNHTRQQLDDEFDRLKARVSPSNSTGAIGFTIQTKRSNLPAVLKLLVEVLREPTFPKEEFDVLKRQSRDSMIKNKTEPQALAGRALMRGLSPFPKDSIRYVPTIDESLDRLEAVTVEDIRELYEDQLGGENGELVIVGDFEPETVTQTLADALKDWKAKTPYKRIERPAKVSTKGEHVLINTPGKASAVYFAGLMLGMNDTSPATAALEVGNYLFGGGSLSSRLGNRVRQKEGLSYGVGSQFGADALDESARFLMFAISNPENSVKVKEVIAEELALMLKEGVTDKELAEAKKAYLQTMKQRRASDGALASLLQEGLQADRTMQYYGNLEKQVASLSTKDIEEAFRQYIDPKRLIVIQAGDFAKNKE